MSPDATPASAALSAALRGRFELIRELGRGGMGLVFLAHDLSLDRFVAIKTLPASRATDPAWRARFLREARAAAQLSHPNIVPIHAVEEHPGAVLFVMAYVPGESLGARVRRAGPLGVREGVRVLREVAWALGHAHARGIVHRDIKPDNVLLDAESGRAMVTDFGLAAHGDGDAPGGGTVRFMSPEQAAGAAVGPASDLYAWGATAWVVATGAPPFDGRSAAAVLAAQVTDPPPAFAMAAPEWPPAMATVVDRVGSELALLGTTTAVSAVQATALLTLGFGMKWQLIGGFGVLITCAAGLATRHAASADRWCGRPSACRRRRRSRCLRRWGISPSLSTSSCPPRAS